LNDTVSIIIPAKNEGSALEKLLVKIQALTANDGWEIIVVNDGSTDDTSSICTSAGVTEVKHLYSKGNGAAIKSGARVAKGENLVFMDGDGQHQPEEIAGLLEKLRGGYHMVVGARNRTGQASLGRSWANGFYNWFASKMVGHEVADLTSGFRAVNAKKFREFLYLLPNGFSYPTTSTMAFFRAGYSVSYMPINVLKREGKSHINLLRDGVRFLLIIFKIGTLYSPLKLFFPVSVGFFASGLGYYLYTYMSKGQFTNMGALLFVTSVIIFFMGLISEQIATLMYARSDS